VFSLSLSLPFVSSTINKSSSKSSGIDSIHNLRCLLRSEVIDLPHIGQSLDLTSFVELLGSFDELEGEKSEVFATGTFVCLLFCTGISVIESSRLMTVF